MLTLTDSASTVVKTLIERTPDAADAALRISASEAGATDLSLAVANQAEPNDTVIESAGAKVYLEQNAALVLIDKVLDAQIDDEGSVRFSIDIQK
ncbi:Fe-S cluster assembly protein HesB [Frigoribacterium sp. CG_9.8]|uniref:Fe-S cluster assembly protein HesB n=1 Tax=Frigoribacterium sp. CG_9.8 TaxID=2787733 RepID=UPI0018C96747|nr:Fe-S cluster assembly protein HesB [Frigoribacterium sp. CG_9.8]MBG6106405.1 Fe-S cluster assembly iron-binding protein IscA [Frigoribacterium sp. CG_9.8]